MWSPPFSIATVCLGAAVAAALLYSGIAGSAPAALADLPVGDPVFSEPTRIDNDLFPVEPGTVKVFAGREGSRRVTIVETHLAETRDFAWRGTSVTCRIVSELKFVAGKLVEQELGFFAQADDGAVYAFGETETGDDDDEPDDDDPDENETSGWVVGSAAPGDPEDTLEVVDPSLFMPVRPFAGDAWNPEDYGPGLTATYTVRRHGARVRVPSGRYAGALRVVETSPGFSGAETKWFAPRAGMVKSSSRTERLRLIATTQGAR